MSNGRRNWSGWLGTRAALLVAGELGDFEHGLGADDDAGCGHHVEAQGSDLRGFAFDFEDAEALAFGLGPEVVEQVVATGGREQLFVCFVVEVRGEGFELDGADVTHALFDEFVVDVLFGTDDVGKDDAGGWDGAVVFADEFGGAEGSAFEAKGVAAFHDPGFEFVGASGEDSAAVHVEGFGMQGFAVEDDLMAGEDIGLYFCVGFCFGVGLDFGMHIKRLLDE